MKIDKLSVEGKKWCDMKNDEENVETEILCRDYRDIPKDRRFNKISSIEMAEHVGLANFVDPYLSGVYRLLEDDGIFLMQVAGLRQGSNWEDVAWGLFMSRYIFPGADAMSLNVVSPSSTTNNTLETLVFSAFFPSLSLLFCCCCCKLFL